jgi:nitrogen fixation protein
MSAINAENIRVFISYSHDSPEHMDRVLMLADRLRGDGIDCIIDQYEISPREGWPRWTMSQIEEARFVLVICTEIYNRRVKGKEETGKGLGAKWEGAIISQELYDSEANNDKFIPVLFSTEDLAHVPVYLRGTTRYVLDASYEDLYRHITNQPKRLKPALGARRSMPPLDRKEDFLPVAESHTSGQPSESGDGWRDVDQSSKPGRDKKQGPPAETHSRMKTSWIFGFLLLAFFVYAYLFSPDTLPEYKQRMLAFASALIAGLFSFFLTGDMGIEINSAQSRIGTINIKATAGFAAFVLMLLWWFSPLAPVKVGPDLIDKPGPELPDIYRVRVTVLDPQQVPVNDAEVQSPAGGELKKSAGGWELSIPAASKPADGKITIYASKLSAALYGQEELVLDKDPSPFIKIQLREGIPSHPPVIGGGSTVGPTRHTPASISIYRVRVSILDPERIVVDDANIQSSLGGELKKIAGGWEIDIPAASKSADGKLIINASKPSAFLKGHAIVQLNKDPNPTVEIQLQRDTSARAHGRVIDGSGQAVVGAWVHVAGHEKERVQTGPGGEFNLAAHAAEGQMVRLLVVKEGYSSEEQQHRAGGRLATIILRKRQ